MPCLAVGFLPLARAMRKRTPHEDELVSERPVQGGVRRSLRIVLEGATVPAIMLLPDDGEEVPAVLLLHGYGSRKEQMADGVGRELLDVGIASLAIDLPVHGERERAIDRDALRDPLEMLALWRAALVECTGAIDWLAAHPAVDPDRIALSGYSMGSFLAVLTAPRAPRVRAIVLAAGGDLPEGAPFTKVVRTLADPHASIQALGGRPLLMVSGKRDRTVTPDQARQLFDAAHEPKEIRWYDSGHWLPDAASRDAAEWLAEKLSARRPREEAGRSRSG